MTKRFRINGRMFRSFSGVTLKVLDVNGKLVGIAKISDILDLINGKRHYVDLCLFDANPEQTVNMRLADPEKLGAP
jgi:hypothetical protein